MISPRLLFPPGVDVGDGSTDAVWIDIVVVEDPLDGIVGRVIGTVGVRDVWLGEMLRCEA